MGNILNFNEWRGINEGSSNPRECLELDLIPLRQTQLYKDVVSMGWTEVDSSGSPRESTYQGEKQGNLRFNHQRLKNTIITNRDGAIWGVKPSGKYDRIFLDFDDSFWRTECINLEDYKSRLEYLIKKILYEDGLISPQELSSREGGIEIIKRKIHENPENIKNLIDIPDSLKKEIGNLAN
jgi:hypothetical protein